MNPPRLHRHILIARTLILVASLGALTLSERKIPSSQSPFWIPSLILLSSLLVNAGYTLLGFLLKKKPLFVLSLELTLDNLLISLLSYASGGVLSRFIFLYYAVILVGTFYVSTRFSLFTASLATIILSLISIAYSYATLGEVSLPGTHASFLVLGRDLSSNLTYLFFFSLSLYVVAVLGGVLSNELKKIHIEREHILESSPVGLFALSPGGEIVFINPAARLLLGLPPPPEVQPSAFANLPALSRQSQDPGLPTIVHLVQRSLEEQRPLSASLWLGPLLLEISTSLIQPHPPRRSQSRSLLVTLLDITHTQELNRARQELERHQIIQETTARVIHEIKNPLATLYASIQHLQNESSHISAEGRELLRILLDEIKRLNRMAETFLTHQNKPEQTENPRQPIDVTQLLNDTLVLLKRGAENRSLSLTSSIQNDLYLEGNEEALKEIVMNLAHNAIEHSRPNSSIFISAYKAWDGPHALEKRLGIVLEITNTPATPDKNPPLGPESTAAPGHGYGLPIVAQHVKKLHGHLESQADASKISFRVWLPVFQDRQRSTVNG